MTEKQTQLIQRDGTKLITDLASSESQLSHNYEKLPENAPERDQIKIQLALAQQVKKSLDKISSTRDLSEKELSFLSNLYNEVIDRKTIPGSNPKLSLSVPNTDIESALGVLGLPSWQKTLARAQQRGTLKTGIEIGDISYYRVLENLMSGTTVKLTQSDNTQSFVFEFQPHNLQP